jgi:hypothetical protein
MVFFGLAVQQGMGGTVSASVPGSQDLLDPVAELRQRLESGETRLAWDSAHGYLSATLEALDIPVSSQTLVFSRTSLQTDRIAPWAPRAVYFNDDVYVAWVQESPSLEIASVDPDGDVRFYTISQVAPDEPVISPRSTTCLMCHESRSVTGGRPGLIMLSVLTDRLGYPIGNVHEGSTTDRTPHASRWGGWYVTGTHGEMAHAGNVRADVLSHEVADGNAHARSFEFGGTNVTDLSEYFFTDAYLTPHSDIVALLVLTHQVNVHNLMGLVRAEAEEALELEGYQIRSGRVEASGPDRHLPSTIARLEGPVDRLFRAMLFTDELPLVAPIAGTAGFAEEFAALGPSNASGSSLRAMDLETRLFRNRLSFLVHSDAFRALPELPRSMLAARLLAVLEGSEPSHLGEAERETILEILRETEPELLALGRS